MGEILPLAVLIAIFLLGLILIPFGLPGLWLMVLALLGYALLDDFQSVGLRTVLIAVAFAGTGEVLEAIVGFRFAKRYGGSSRAGWGAIIGGVVGAVVGTPVPLLGNLVGAFVGAFAGAALFEATRHGELGRSMSAGWGAVLGRAAAAAVKVGVGVGVGVLGVYAAVV